MIVQVKPGDVWEYARQRMPVIMRDNLSLYAILLLAGIVLTSRGSTPRNFHTAGFEWIAGIAALGAAVRGIVPTYAMTLRAALWIIFFYLLLLAGVCIAFVTPIALGLWVGQPGLFWILLPEIFALLWIGVKLSATPAFYALHRDRSVTIFGAMALSWQRISGERWAQLFGIQVVVGIGATLLIVILCFGPLFALPGSPTAAVILASSGYYLVALPTTALSTALTVAVAASSEAVSAPATPAV